MLRSAAILSTLRDFFTGGDAHHKTGSVLLLAEGERPWISVRPWPSATCLVLLNHETLLFEPVHDFQ